MVDLTVAKAERAKLQSSLQKLAEHRGRLADDAATILADAERELGEFEASYTAAVIRWSEKQSGAKPIQDAGLHEALLGKCSTARRHGDAIERQFKEIQARERQIRDEIAALDITGMAAQVVAADFSELGSQARDLRQSLAEMEDKLIAGAAFFKDIADRHYETTGKRNPRLDAPVTAALKGLPELSAGEQHPIPSRDAVAAQRAAFEELQR